MTKIRPKDRIQWMNRKQRRVERKEKQCFVFAFLWNSWHCVVPVCSIYSRFTLLLVVVASFFLSIIIFHFPLMYNLFPFVWPISCMAFIYMYNSIPMYTRHFFYCWNCCMQVEFRLFFFSFFLEFRIFILTWELNSSTFPFVTHTHKFTSNTNTLAAFCSPCILTTKKNI